MSRFISALALAALALAPAFLPARATSPAQGTCYPDWSDAAPIVARERLLPARDVQEMSRRLLAGDVVHITLCREGAGYVYRVLLKDAKGRITNTIISAHGPAGAVGQKVDSR